MNSWMNLEWITRSSVLSVYFYTFAVPLEDVATCRASVSLAIFLEGRQDCPALFLKLDFLHFSCLWFFLLSNTVWHFMLWGMNSWHFLLHSMNSLHCSMNSWHHVGSSSWHFCCAAVSSGTLVFFRIKKTHVPGAGSPARKTPHHNQCQ